MSTNSKAANILACSGQWVRSRIIKQTHPHPVADAMSAGDTMSEKRPARRAADISSEDSLIAKIPESPWWAKVGVKLGLSTVMTLVFVWWLITSVSPKIDRIDAAMDRHLDDMKSNTRILERISNVLIQTCVDRRRDRQETISGCFGETGFPETK